MERSPSTPILVPLAAYGRLIGEDDRLPLVRSPMTVLAGEVEPDLPEPRREADLGVAVPATQAGLPKASSDCGLAHGNVELLLNLAGGEEGLVDDCRDNHKILLVARSSSPPLVGCVLDAPFVTVRVDNAKHGANSTTHHGRDGTL